MQIIHMFKHGRRVILSLIAANFALILTLVGVAAVMGGTDWPWNENGEQTFCLDHRLSAQSMLVDQQVRTFKLFSQPSLVTCTWHDAGRVVITTFGNWPQTLVQTSLMYLVICAQYSIVALVVVALASALVWAFRSIGRWSGSDIIRK